MATGDLIPGLPDDLAVQCIAWVPFRCYSSISLVSRSWYSLIRSPLLFSMRSSLGASERQILLALGPCFEETKWLLLQPSNGGLVQYLPPAPLTIDCSSCASLGTSVYVLGGYTDSVGTNAVQVIHLPAPRWRLAPRMLTRRGFSAAAAVMSQLYVVGGCCPSCDSWFEVLNDAGEAWEKVPSSGDYLEGRVMVVMADGRGLIYDTLRRVAVDGVIYTIDYRGMIKGYEPELDEWLVVEGLEDTFPCYATLTNVGGVLCLLWEWKEASRRKDTYSKMVLEVTGIDVTRVDNGTLKGSILWSESFALDVPKDSSTKCCVSLEF